MTASQFIIDSSAASGTAAAFRFQLTSYTPSKMSAACIYSLVEVPYYGDAGSEFDWPG